MLVGSYGALRTRRAVRDCCTGTNGRVEREEDTEVDDVEQAQLWRVIRELHYAAGNVGRKKKTSGAVFAPSPLFLLHRLT